MRSDRTSSWDSLVRSINERCVGCEADASRGGNPDWLIFQSWAGMTLREESTPTSTPKQLCRIVRVLGVHPSAKAPSPLPHDDQPHHSSGHHVEVILDSLEKGQLLEDDPYLSDSMLTELGIFGMEGLG